MEFERIEKAVKEKGLYLSHPDFYDRAYSFAVSYRKARHARDGDNFKRVAVEEYLDISHHLDLMPLQESCAVRNVLRTRRLANILIDDQGDLNTASLPKVIAHFQHHLYSIGPNRQFDSKRQEHILQVLVLLNENKELVRLLKSIDKPVSHPYAEKIIRNTLSLSDTVTLTNAHTRRAVLSAWLCFLRQNVGSCFATAPAILIHDEQPEMFLKDVRDLLNTGRLKRTYGGVEYSVPLSASWGAGDLKKPFVVPCGENFNKSHLWLSPGLLAALEAVNIIDSELKLEDQHDQIKTLLLEVFNSKNISPYVIVTAEEIIRKILLKKLGLTEQDIEDFENRSKGLIPTALIMQGGHYGGKTASKGDLCASFLHQFIEASDAFKALADNALLKAWEFSLASFSEIKAQFTRWNLYASLGLGPHEAGGIGHCLHEVVSEKLEQANRRVQDFQYEYEQVFNQLKAMEARVNSVNSERDGQWLKVEYQSKRNEFYTLEGIRDDLNYKARQLANLHNVIVAHYDTLFPSYFQEVYDADMHDVSTGPYDDSPAGFRLLYKYGRSNTSQWSYIKTPNEFIDDLAAFFTSTESEIKALEAAEGLEKEVSEIITAVVSHVRTKEFIESAFYRMAKAHQTRAIKDPLEHLDKIDKKPWAYTSGGTMDTLVSCYYRLENRPKDVARWVENPMELFVFLVDTLKQAAPKMMEEYLLDGDKSMLMQSPTHAFLLKPGYFPFNTTWQNNEFTYTWLRDNFVNPRKNFIESLWLDEEKMAFLIDYFAKEYVPEENRHYFTKVFSYLHGSMRPMEFRQSIIKEVKLDRGLRNLSQSLTPEKMDGALFSLLPLFSKIDLREKVLKIFEELPFLDEKMVAQLMQLFALCEQSYPPVEGQGHLVTAAKLQEICKGLLCLLMSETSLNKDFHGLISSAAQKLGYAMPAPVIFADTNWVKEYFGFVVNPGTGKWELWRVDITGREGSPMTVWDQWLDGSRKDISWGIYHHPYEYRPSVSLYN